MNSLTFLFGCIGHMQKEKKKRHLYLKLCISALRKCSQIFPGTILEMSSKAGSGLGGDRFSR